MTKFSLTQKYYVWGSARTHMRITSARKKRPLGMCVVLCQVPTVCWTSSLSLHDSYYIEFHCPHLMDEKCDGRPRPQSSVWHSQDANPEIQGHCSLVPTTHDCFCVNGLNFFFFFANHQHLGSLLSILWSAVQPVVLHPCLHGWIRTPTALLPS